MKQGQKKPDPTERTIVALRCKEGVGFGTERMGHHVLSSEVDSLDPVVYAGLPGFMMTQGTGAWFVPVQNVIEVIFAKEEAA